MSEQAGPRPTGESQEHPCAEASAREAGYLLALRKLTEEHGSVTQVALARAMGVSAPTALEMIRRLRQFGLVEPKQLKLTKDGTSAALLLSSRRHAAHLLTREVLGIEEQGANADADRLAARISPELTRRLMASRPERS